MSQISGAGGQPQKSPRYAPIYTGRVFNGLCTNRSPLRGNLPSQYEQFYKISYGDVMIAGANVEVSNRLTLVRRPGNSIFSGAAGTTFNDILAFDEFRVNKQAADAWGLTLEEIFTMISEPGQLLATNAGVTEQVFADPSALGQTFMQAIGNELYFSNGIDNKKWLQSLIVWAPNFSPQGTNGLVGTYPFMSTYLLTGATSATSNTQQLQQFIGIAIANITNVAVAGGVLTLTVNNTGLPNVGTTVFPVNTMFQLWGVNIATWLNGAIITINSAFTEGTSTTITAQYIAPAADVTYGPAADTGYVQQIGTTPVVAITGSTTPAWGTSAISNTDPAWGSTSPTGNILLDGNMLWVDRGSTVENWGIAAPTSAPVATDVNSTTVGWKASTYYSAPGVFIDSNGNIWQVTTPGTTGPTAAPFLAQPTPTPGVSTVTSGTAVFTNRGTVVAAGTTWAPHASYKSGAWEGAYPWTAITTPSDGQFLPDWESGQFLVANSAGTPCLFMLQKNIPINDVNVPISATFGGGLAGQPGWSAKFFNHSGSDSNVVDLDWGGSVGAPVLYGTSTPQPPTATADGLSSTLWNFMRNGSSVSYDHHPMQLQTTTVSGEYVDGTFTTPWPGMPTNNFEFLQYGKIRIPVPGMTVTFNILIDDCAWFGVESTAGAEFMSFSSNGGASNLQDLGTRTLTPWNGYPIIAGSNGRRGSIPSGVASTDTIVITFPNAGVFGIEFAFGQRSGHLQFAVSANGSTICPEQAIADPFFQTTGVMPSFGSAGWNLLSAAQNTYPSVVEVGNNTPYPDVTTPFTYTASQLAWFNLGPITDMAFAANTPVTLPSVRVIDTNNNEQADYESGVSGTVQPTWQTALYATTADRAPLQWINEGSIPPANAGLGQITATTVQGWEYWIALVNTLDNTVSNVGPASLGTGPIINGNVTLPAGSGLDVNAIDPQADYVAIFRSTDGGPFPLLINGLGNSFWTVPLTQYLQNGYLDTTPDVNLNELITGATAGQNTPPLPGISNLAFHIGRGFYSIGNTVFYTSGSNSGSGNGTGTSPQNFTTLPSRVVRLVPTAIGLLVFTISDIYIIAGNGTTNSPILPAVPYLTGVGLANYNALDINGSLIGFFTTDKQFLLFDPSAGLSYVGNPIGDQFRLNNGTPGQSWDTGKVFVTWYTNGEDQGWFVGDGQFGWYKLIATPSPEVGQSWSPFATVANGGISAMRSVETSPGVHTLLVGPSGTGNILARDLNATTDGGTTGSNGTPFPAYGIFGSYVLALPGQVAKVAFITTVSVRVGSPLVIGLLLDEALPYYKGSLNILKHWVTDPPEIPESKSFYKQRFYLSEDHSQTAYCSDLQFMVQWPAEAAASELQTFTLWGAYDVEA